MTNTSKCLMVAVAIASTCLLVRHEMNTAREDFGFALTADWSSTDYSKQWEPVVADEGPEEVSMDDVFHAAIAPRQSRLAAANATEAVR